MTNFYFILKFISGLKIMENNNDLFYFVLLHVCRPEDGIANVETFRDNDTFKFILRNYIVIKSTVIMLWIATAYNSALK
jgi:hypothetical protein